ncbi:MAG TPA: TolC family outer membrane protein, partial [Candidatus Saccharimonadia bacterium]|nr:TolC family outer membrane protein [Candidatus Saccharimonadia bacterium]
MRFSPQLVLTALALAVGAAFAPPAAAEDLLEIYELARASDPQLSFVDANRRAIAEGVAQSRALLLPNITGTANLGDSDNDSTGLDATIQPDGSVEFGQFQGAQDARTRTYRVSLLQSIYNHSNYTRLRSARATRSRAEADYEAALDNLFTRVALAYFTALNNTSNVEALRAEETAVGRQLEQADQRFEVGLTAITDVHEARARFDSARANRILAETQLNDSHEALRELTGKQIETLEALREDIPLAAPEPADPEAWVTVALDENAVLESRRHAVRATEHDIGTAKAGHLPYLSGSVTFTDNAQWGESFNEGGASRVTFPVDTSFDDTSFGLLLTVPIFEGFAVQSRVRQAVALRDVNAELLEQDQRAVERTTRNNYRAVVAGVSEVEARRQALVSA